MEKNLNTHIQFQAPSLGNLHSKIKEEIITRLHRNKHLSSPKETGHFARAI